MHDDPKIHPSLARLYALALHDFHARGPTEVGRLIGESSQVVNNWGRDRGVSKLGAIKIQSLLGWSALYIREGKGPQRVALEGGSAAPLSPVTMLPPRLVRRVPIVGQVKQDGDKDTFIVEPFTAPLSAVGAYTGGAPVRALCVATDAFYPRFRSGEYVVVAEQTSAVNGDDVIVTLKGNGKGPPPVSLYQFLYETENNFVFQHFREGTQVTVDKDAVVLMEPIFGVYNKRAKLAPQEPDVSE